MLNFQEFIFSKYRYFNKGKEIIPLVKPSLEKKLYIPLTKIAKYFIRLYTLDTDFHKDLNIYLSNIDGFGPYKIFILILQKLLLLLHQKIKKKKYIFPFKIKV